MAVDERLSGLQRNNPHISPGGRLLFWESNQFLDSQEISSILWNPVMY